MYSYEDQLRAVQPYIKLDKRIGLTIRQLGYPTKNAFKTWRHEYEQSQELRAGYTRPAKFSQAEKERAVEHCVEHGRCIAATIKALGYPSRALLSAWLQELHPQCKRVVGRSQELAPQVKQSAVIALCARSASAHATTLVTRSLPRSTNLQPEDTNRIAGMAEGRMSIHPSLRGCMTGAISNTLSWCCDSCHIHSRAGYFGAALPTQRVTWILPPTNRVYFGD